MGDVGAVAKLLSEVFGFAVNDSGYAEMSREKKLKWIARGVDDALASDNWAAYDQLLAELRSLRGETGP